MMFYPEAIATIKASGVPWPVAMLHIGFGFKTGKCCGECRHWIYQSKCGKSWSDEDVVADTLACGKFAMEKTRT